MAQDMPDIEKKLFIFLNICWTTDFILNAINMLILYIDWLSLESNWMSLTGCKAAVTMLVLWNVQTTSKPHEEPIHNRFSIYTPADQHFRICQRKYFLVWASLWAVGVCWLWQWGGIAWRVQQFEMYMSKWGITFPSESFGQPFRQV